MVMQSAKRKGLEEIIDETVEGGAQICTDDYTAYMGLREAYAYAVINHAEKYVDGQIHTNGIETFGAC